MFLFHITYAFACITIFFLEHIYPSNKQMFIPVLITILFMFFYLCQPFYLVKWNGAIFFLIYNLERTSGNAGKASLRALPSCHH